MSAIREHMYAVHAEWLALPGYKPDLDAAQREMEFVSEYVRIFFRLPPQAEREVEWHATLERLREARRNSWSIFKFVAE